MERYLRRVAKEVVDEQEQEQEWREEEGGKAEDGRLVAQAVTHAVDSWVSLPSVISLPSQQTRSPFTKPLYSKAFKERSGN